MSRRTQTIPAEVQDFPSLIRWLIDKYDDGVKLRMSSRLGVSSALISQWESGKTKVPRGPIISKLCAEYNLDSDEVYAIIRKRRPRAIPREVVDLKSLMHWIAKEHHPGRGAWAAMAKRVGVSPTLIGFWKSGNTKSPQDENHLVKFCNAYDLPIKEVRALLSKGR